MRSGMLKTWMAGVAVFATTLAAAGPAMAVEFYTSFTTDETIDSTTFLEEDVLLVEDTGVSVYQSTVPFFTQNEDLDALFVDSNGDIYFSTSGGATIVDDLDGSSVGGIDSGDIIRYRPTEPVDSQFTTYIPDAGPNVDAFWIEDGVPYISLSVDGTLGTNAVSVLDDHVFTLTGDLDLDTGTVTVVFDSNDYLLDVGDTAGTSTDIDAFAITDDGMYLFSSSSTNGFLMEGGDPENFEDYVDRDGGVVFIVDPTLDPALFDAREESAVYFDSSVTYETGINVDALGLPLTGTPELDADFNGDGTVNIADYTVWRDNLGATGLTPFDLGDADGDGAVDAADYEAWKSLFGTTTGAVAGLDASPVSVPEPSTFALLALVGTGLVLGGRRVRR